MDKSATIIANNIIVASGYKCKHCGVIRSFDRLTCFCEKARKERQRTLKYKQ